MLLLFNYILRIFIAWWKWLLFYHHWRHLTKSYINNINKVITIKVVFLLLNSHLNFRSHSNSYSSLFLYVFRSLIQFHCHSFFFCSLLFKQLKHNIDCSCSEHLFSTGCLLEILLAIICGFLHPNAQNLIFFSYC